jgi:transcriptional regulator with XRE-family HTH domain
MKKSNDLPVSASRLLAQLGENLKLARLRRKLSGALVAERAGISRSTLHHVERGSPHVAMGAYFLVLFVLGLEKDLLAVGRDDELGRRLQDAGLLVRRRAPRRPPARNGATL